MKIINEGKNIDYLYKAVRIQYLKDIIDNDVLKATNYGNKKSVCLSRSSKWIGLNSGDRVNIKLDGEKLSDNYKIYPYSNPGDDKLRFNEYEERIDKDINNLSKYIVSIDLSYLKNIEFIINRSGFKSIDDIEEYLESKNIKIIT